MRVTSVTPANESRSNRGTTFEARISSSFIIGNTDAKHRTKRSSCSDIGNLYDVVRQDRDIGVERSPVYTRSRSVRLSQQFCKEVSDRSVARSRFIFEYDFFRIEFLEQVLQAVMLNASRKRPTAHDPSTHMDFTSKCFTHDYRDLAERAVFVFI